MIGMCHKSPARHYNLCGVAKHTESVLFAGFPHGVKRSARCSAHYTEDSSVATNSVNVETTASAYIFE